MCFQQLSKSVRYVILYVHIQKQTCAQIYVCVNITRLIGMHTCTHNTHTYFKITSHEVYQITRYKALKNPILDSFVPWPMKLPWEMHLRLVLCPSTKKEEGHRQGALEREWSVPRGWSGTEKPWLQSLSSCVFLGKLFNLPDPPLDIVLVPCKCPGKWSDLCQVLAHQVLSLLEFGKAVFCGFLAASSRS